MIERKIFRKIFPVITEYICDDIHDVQIWNVNNWKRSTSIGRNETRWIHNFRVTKLAQCNIFGTNNVTPARRGQKAVATAVSKGIRCPWCFTRVPGIMRRDDKVSKDLSPNTAVLLASLFNRSPLHILSVRWQIFSAPSRMIFQENLPERCRFVIMESFRVARLIVANIDSRVSSLNSE